MKWTPRFKAGFKKNKALMKKETKATRELKKSPIFVYFNQRLGAVHAKGWWKYAFIMFLCKKHKKRKRRVNEAKNVNCRSLVNGIVVIENIIIYNFFQK